jgi:hypothetical protein
MPAIVGIIALGGTVIVRFLPNKDRREGSWQEVVTENRSLRSDLEELRERFEKFEQKTNVRVGALSNMLHQAADTWPQDSPGPYFDRRDLDALEITDIPYVWRGRYRSN